MLFTSWSWMYRCSCGWDDRDAFVSQQNDDTKRFHVEPLHLRPPTCVPCCAISRASFVAKIRGYHSRQGTHDKSDGVFLMGSSSSLLVLAGLVAFEPR